MIDKVWQSWVLPQRNSPNNSWGFDTLASMHRILESCPTMELFSSKNYRNFEASVPWNFGVQRDMWLNLTFC